ncbi:hypothetical protein [Flyfo myovirus Tbat2_7]|nr:hypothetical protein [Flyfo myovirus Tbat2_7]
MNEHEIFQHLAAITAMFILVGIPFIMALILFLIIGFINKK